jgi:hypothetical protein
MSDLSPIDASMLALIAENRKSPAQVQKLLARTSLSARRIAKSIISPRARGRKSDRQVAKSIRKWAATNSAR